MIFTDEITVKGQTVPANVGVTLARIWLEPGEARGGFYLQPDEAQGYYVEVERVRAQVEPDLALHTRGAVYRWHGENYISDAPPHKHIVHGELHHLTITLFRQTIV